MDKIGWKVVRPEGGGGLTSCRMDRNTEWCVSYEVGMPSKGPHDTPLLAFRTRQAARDFGCFGDYIFKAKLENAKPITALASWLVPGSFRWFWEHRPTRHGAPRETLACDAITLLEPA